MFSSHRGFQGKSIGLILSFFWLTSNVIAVSAGPPHGEAADPRSRGSTFEDVPIDGQNSKVYAAAAMSQDASRPHGVIPTVDRTRRVVLVDTQNRSQKAPRRTVQNGLGPYPEHYQEYQRKGGRPGPTAESHFGTT